MNHYVYEITNLVNGKKYIGKRSCHCPIEEDRYMGSGTILKEDKEKYGLNNFSKKILAIADNDDMVYDLESYYIEKRNAVESKEYYNQVYGGDVSHMFKHHNKGKEENVRKMISEKNKGKNMGSNNKVSKKVICLTNKKIFDSTAAAAKYVGLSRCSISRVCRPNYHTRHAGKDPITGEYLEWMFYDEYIALKEGRKYNYSSKTTQYTKKGIKVICLNTKQIFDSITEACNKLGINVPSNISKCCKGKCETAGKHPITGEFLKWMYYKDYLKQVEYGEIS